MYITFYNPFNLDPCHSRICFKPEISRIITLIEMFPVKHEFSGLGA